MNLKKKDYNVVGSLEGWDGCRKEKLQQEEKWDNQEKGWKKWKENHKCQGILNSLIRRGVNYTLTSKH